VSSVRSVAVNIWSVIMTVMKNITMKMRHLQFLPSLSCITDHFFWCDKSSSLKLQVAVDSKFWYRHSLTYAVLSYTVPDVIQFW
jgi:hypothetical protein